jgi:hypothetical protein
LDEEWNSSVFEQALGHSKLNLIVRLKNDSQAACRLRLLLLVPNRSPGGNERTVFLIHARYGGEYSTRPPGIKYIGKGSADLGSVIQLVGCGRVGVSWCQRGPARGVLAGLAPGFKNVNRFPNSGRVP